MPGCDRYKSGAFRSKSEITVDGSMFIVPDMQLPDQQSDLDIYLCPWNPQRASAIKPPRDFESWMVTNTARMSVDRDTCSFGCINTVDKSKWRTGTTHVSCKPRLNQQSTQVGWSWSTGPNGVPDCSKICKKGPGTDRPGEKAEVGCYPPGGRPVPAGSVPLCFGGMQQASLLTYSSFFPMTQRFDFKRIHDLCEDPKRSLTSSAEAIACDEYTKVTSRTHVRTHVHSPAQHVYSKVTQPPEPIFVQEHIFEFSYSIDSYMSASAFTQVNSTFENMFNSMLYDKVAGIFDNLSDGMFKSKLYA